MPTQQIPATQIPSHGYLRLKQILGDKKAKPPIPPIFPVCRSTWLQGVKDNIYPKPVKLGARSVGWRIEDILSLIANPQS